jgi:hypothetical protein
VVVKQITVEFPLLGGREKTTITHNVSPIEPQRAEDGTTVAVIWTVYKICKITDLKSWVIAVHRWRVLEARGVEKKCGKSDGGVKAARGVAKERKVPQDQCCPAPKQLPPDRASK